MWKQEKLLKTCSIHAHDKLKYSLARSFNHTNSLHCSATASCLRIAHNHQATWECGYRFKACTYLQPSTTYKVINILELLKNAEAWRNQHQIRRASQLHRRENELQAKLKFLPFWHLTRRQCPLEKTWSGLPWLDIPKSFSRVQSYNDSGGPTKGNNRKFIC